MDPNNVEELRAAMERILSDTALARELGQKAERYSRASFDPRALSLQVGELYRALV